MKRLINHTFHTKLLIPKDVVTEGKKKESQAEMLEHLLIWQDAYRSDHHFKRGDECYHVDNLNQILHVDKVIRSFPKPKNGESQSSKIEGILCHWWEECPGIDYR